MRRAAARVFVRRRQSGALSSTIEPPSDFFDSHDIDKPLDPSPGAPLSPGSKARGHTALSTGDEGILRFNSLSEFLRLKKRVESSSNRQAMAANGYDVVRFLGRGRFGNVFLATEQHSMQQRAIKIINVERSKREFNWTWLTDDERRVAAEELSKLEQFGAEVLCDDGFVKDQLTRSLGIIKEKLDREANPLERKTRRPVAEREILLRCGFNAFISNLHSSFRDSKFLYLVFDYFPGGTVAGLLKKRETFEESVAAFYAAELLLALEYLASVDVSHRDVKPSNMLLNKSGHVVVCDFGLATRLKGGLKTFCGTADYIAPEVLSEKTWSARYLDLWAFGVTLFQMLAGHTPFKGPDASTVFLNTLTSKLVFPEHFSEEAVDLLDKVLSRDYSKRPSVSEIKTHQFFKSIDWDAVAAKRVEPPFKPDEVK